MSEPPLPRLHRLLAPLLAGAWLTLAVVAGPRPSVAQEKDQGGDSARALAVLDRAARSFESLEGFCACFEQERVVPLLSQTTVSRGELCQKPPGFFRMDFSDPEGDLVVADGEHVWTYYPSVNPGQVIRARLGGGGRTFDFHGEFLADPQERFRVAYQGRDTVTGRTTDVVELRPRSRTSYVRARVWIERDRGLIRKVEIEEENQAVRRVVLSDLRVDPGLEPSAFRFEPPPGVQVIRR